MISQNSPLSEKLLGKIADPTQLDQYREQVRRSLKREQKRLQFQRVATVAFWIFAAILATAWIWFGTSSTSIPRGPMAAGILLLCGGIEVIKHAVSAGRFEMLMEIKQVQLQISDLERLLHPQSSSQS
jgi:small neutral amino acid transporter SnatA (MarC family)